MDRGCITRKPHPARGRLTPPSQCTLELWRATSRLRIRPIELEQGQVSIALESYLLRQSYSHAYTCRISARGIHHPGCGDKDIPHLFIICVLEPTFFDAHDKTFSSRNLSRSILVCIAARAPVYRLPSLLCRDHQVARYHGLKHHHIRTTEAALDQDCLSPAELDTLKGEVLNEKT